MCLELRTPLANVSKRNLFSSAFALLFGANVFRKFLQPPFQFLRLPRDKVEGMRKEISWDHLFSCFYHCIDEVGRM